MGLKQTGLRRGGLLNLSDNAPLDFIVTKYEFENSGNTSVATDAVGANDANINGATYDSNSRCDSFAMRFDGVDDTVVSQSTVDLSAKGSTDGASVGGFFNPDTTGFQLLGGWAQDGDNFLRINTDGNGNFEVASQLNAANFSSTSGGSVSTSQYQHVVGGYDGTDIFLIVDGTEVARTTSQSDLTNLGAASLRVGNIGITVNYFDGLADNAVYSDKALSESDAQELINQC